MASPTILSCVLTRVLSEWCRSGASLVLWRSTSDFVRSFVRLLVRSFVRSFVVVVVVVVVVVEAGEWSDGRRD